MFAGQWFKQRGKSNYSIVQDKRLTVATVTFRKTSRGVWGGVVLEASSGRSFSPQQSEVRSL